MRTVGIDLGEKRMGIAVSDSNGEIAVPHSVIQLTGDEQADLQSVLGLILELNAELVVVGLPLSLNSKGTNNQESTSTQKAKSYTQLLQKNLEVSVVLHDERMSTIEAEKKLKLIGISSKKARKQIDMMAATVILQSWLDTERIKEDNPK